MRGIPDVRVVAERNGARDRFAVEGAGARTAASWQARVALGALPFVAGHRRSACVAAVPDVARVRARARRLSMPGAWLAALLNPRSRRTRDARLDGLWTWPSPRPGPIVHAILYLHGGGFYFGSPSTHRAVT
ncbi:MAG TPA: hypothetical protein VN289_12545, partial [Paraburkholderia sp.]|nr:hypothetical protein [Paraburkholderia sp.]